LSTRRGCERAESKGGAGERGRRSKRRNGRIVEEKRGGNTTDKREFRAKTFKKGIPNSLRPKKRGRVGGEYPQHRELGKNG